MFKGKRCLVTGGTGLIGRKVVSMLCDLGAIVRVSSKDNLDLEDRSNYWCGDLRSFDDCEFMTRDMDYVFHLAGIKGNPMVTKTHPSSFFVPMLMMNTNILEACRINEVKGIVFTSSIGAYMNMPLLKEEGAFIGNPMDTYPGWAKRMAEMQIQTYKIQYHLENFSIVRITSTFGEGDNFDPDNAMVIPSLMAKIARGDNPVKIWGDGSEVRDFAYSEDIARGILLAMEKGTKGKIVNLGSGKGTTIKELVETLASFIDFKYEWVLPEVKSHSVRVMDISLAKEILGYEPKISLREGLQRTWNWYLENKEEHLKKQNYFKEG